MKMKSILSTLFIVFVFFGIVYTSHKKHYVKYENQLLTKFGKELFFDKRLSSNNEISCATCHQPKKLFSDGLSISKQGVSGKELKRHTPSLLNLKNNSHFFADGGIETIESTMLGPIQNADEMNQNLRELEVEVNQVLKYKTYSKIIFDQDSVFIPHLMKAIGSYLRTLESKESRYDDYLKGKVKLSNEERMGLDIFKKNCISCHEGENFTDNQFHNLGIETEDKGRFIITLDSADLFRFKTPSLRNINFTAPYFHNGKAKTLSDAISQHESVIEDKLNKIEIENLIEFMKMLTDKRYTKP